MLKWQRVLVEAFQRGYCVDEYGNIRNINRKIVKPRANKDNILVVTVCVEGFFPQPIPVKNIIAYKKYGEKIFDRNYKIILVDNDQFNTREDNIKLVAYGYRLETFEVEQPKSDNLQVILENFEVISYLKEKGFSNEKIMLLLE